MLPNIFRGKEIRFGGSFPQKIIRIWKNGKGKIHDILGERKNAVKYYRDCIQLDNYSYAIKEAENYIDKPFKK